MNFRTTNRTSVSRPGRTVLLVEDNPLFGQVMARAVRRMDSDWQIQACEFGLQAIGMLAGGRVEPDLVLVDLGLPDISGIEVIEAARNRCEDVPIMVVSVISAERTVLRAIRAGARGYVLKGDSEESISQAIEEVLQGNYPITPSLARSLFRLAGAPQARSTQTVHLAPRELQTLQWIAKGKSYLEVAQKMGVALSTVQSNIRNLYRKLEVRSQVQAVAKGRDTGLI